MIDLGTVKPGRTLRIPFSSFDKDDGASITMTNYAVADILIYKDGGTTERASTAGFTATTDFDSKTGKHVAVIDLADNTTAGFFSAGSDYAVAIDAVTVDAVTTGGWVASFRIGYPNAVLDTTIATLASQTSFTLTEGPAEDDALNGHWAIIHDVASKVQWSRVEVLDYTGSTRTVTLAAGATFTAAATDNFSLMEPSPLRPATTGRTAAIGTAGQIDANLTQAGGTNVTASGGRPEVNTTHAAGTAWGSGAITAASIASDAITAAKIASDAITAAKIASDAITSAKIADNAITANKIASDAITAAKVATGAITAAKFAASAIDAAALAADAVTEIQSGLATAAALATVDGIVDDILLDTAEIGAAGAGLTAINLPDQTMNITGNITGNLSGSVGSVTGAVGSVAGNVGGNVAGSVGSVTAEVTPTAASKTGYRLSATGVGDILTTALTESYAADGAAPTLSQAVFAIQQMMQERAIVSTTLTVNKLDGTTAAMTFTLDDANSPTSITRAT